MSIDIIAQLTELHGNDQDQLAVVFSEKKRILVDAHAGCGKTKTLVSKIAYMLATDKVSDSGKILVLAETIDAAYEIKKSLNLILPLVVPSCVEKKHIQEIVVDNYHGFCSYVLKQYGGALHDNFRNIDSMRCVDDTNAEEIMSLATGLTYEDAQELADFDRAIKERDEAFLKRNYYSYMMKVRNFFLDNRYISFNGLLIFAIELFKKNPQITRFYQEAFPVLAVDEFQMIDGFRWMLLKEIISENSRIFFMGDSLQHVYGITAVVPDLVKKTKDEYGMEVVALKTNYKFKDNFQLSGLDKNIRANAVNPFSPVIEKKSSFDVYETDTQEEESAGIVSIIKKILARDETATIAILVKQKDRNTRMMIEALNRAGIPFFYGLYSQDDSDYVQFHQEASRLFLEMNGVPGGVINTNTCDVFLARVREFYAHKNSELFNALKQLLEAFLKNIFVEFDFLSCEEKKAFMKQTLENKILKYSIKYLNPKIIISTFAGIRGLRWDYVLLPDMEQYSFPDWAGLCNLCQFKNTCVIDWNETGNAADFESQFYKELAMFYSAVTSARKELYFSYSKTRVNEWGKERETNMSCLLKMPGIECRPLRFIF